MNTTKNFELNQICCCTGSYRPSFYRVVKLTAKTAWFQRLQTHIVEASPRWGESGKMMPLMIDDRRQEVFKKRIKTWGDSWPSKKGLQHCFEKYMGFIEPWDNKPQPFSTYD